MKKKLMLNKKTIASLDANQLESLQGGAIPIRTDTCETCAYSYCGYVFTCLNCTAGGACITITMK